MSFSIFFRCRVSGLIFDSWKNSIWYFLVKPSACELRVAQYEKPLTKGHCPIKQRDQNSAKDPDKIAKKRSERRERSHLLKEKIIKLIEGGLQLSEYQARKVKWLCYNNILDKDLNFELIADKTRT